jgi:hypothetical protein
MQQVDNRPLLQNRQVGHGLLQRNQALSQTSATCGQRASELRSWRQCRARLTRRRIVAGLKDLAKALRVTLRPPTSDRGVVVDEDVRAIRYRLAFKEGIEQQKELTILVAGRIEIFLVGSRELPVIEECIAMSFRCRDQDPVQEAIPQPPAAGSDQNSMLRKSDE